MALRNYAWAATVLLLLGPVSLAQNTPKADVAVGYSLANSVQSPSLTANGVTGSFAWNLTHWLGAVGDFAVYTASPAGISLTAETYTGGARFSYRRWERFTPFAQVLLGGVHASAGAGVLSATTDKFGAGAGGGLGIAPDKSGRLALRPQLDYFAGQSTGNTPSTVRLSLSLVYRVRRR